MDMGRAGHRHPAPAPCRCGGCSAGGALDCRGRAGGDGVRVGVSVAARAVLLYDWLDNFGRRSPREADPSLTGLEVGQSFMTIFELVGFAAPSSVRLRMQEGWPTAAFGAIDLTYSIEVADAERTRLSAVMWMPPIGRVLGRTRRYLLAWGDLVMMRKQLRTLAALAERDTSHVITRH